MRVHHVNAGTMCPVAGRLLNEHRRLVCHCWIVETDRGLVVVDTGVGLLDIEQPSRLGTAFVKLVGVQLDAEATLARHVERLGFSRTDVRHVVVTHLDLDHAGGLPDFPDAVVHLHRDEHRAAMERRSLPEKSRYRPVQWAHRPRWATYEASAGEPWLGFECVRDLDGLPPEILIVPLFGHTRGHSGIAVQTSDGWRLHAGDAYFHHGEVETPPHCPLALRAFQGALDADRRARLDNQARLRELVQAHPEVRVTCAHDPAELERAQGA